MRKKQESCAMPMAVDKDVIAYLKGFNGVREAGRRLNLSATYISRILTKKERPSVRLAALAGWEKRITWRKANA